MKLSLVYILLTFIVLVGCTQSWIKTRRTKNIRLSEFENERRLGYETDSAIIYFRISDVTDLLEDQQKEYGDCKECRDFIVRLQNVEKDTIIQQNKEVYILNSLGGYVKSYFTPELLTEGNAMVYDKRNQDYVNRIKYEFLKDRLGGKSGTFYFQDGGEFYSIILALGE